MIRLLKDYSGFLWRSAKLATDGDWRYYAWLGLLFVISLFGLNAYSRQLAAGLAATDMSDQVCWGVYIANFTFLVGVADAAVMLVIPVFIYKRRELADLVIFGILLAIVAIVMCLCFVMVDLGRPDRFWHLLPGIGKFNFPASLLSWDVIVLNGYLALNVYICGYLLYMRYRHREPVGWHYLPWLFLSIFWAIAIHSVTAFLYVGLGGRPFWNNSIVGPRFIASAFVSGPALVIIAMQMVRRVTARRTKREDQHGLKDLPIRRATLEDFHNLARHLPELASLSDSQLEQCLEGSKIQEADADDVFLLQGGADNDAFFVIDGFVVVRREEHGRQRLIRRVGPGEQFGEISALTGSTRTATATADGPARVLRVDAKTLKRLMASPAVNSLVNARMTERLAITDRALMTLRAIVQVAMLVNVFLLLNELFKEFYTDNLHASSARYLYFGLHGHNGLVPWIWTAIFCNLVALILLVLPISRSLKWLDLACVLAIFGVWIEKGMGLVVPGQIPSPLGEIIEYSPTLDESLVCFGIWAFGILCYSVLLRVAIPIMQGKFRADDKQPAAA
ncbi:MAG: polysulfide reductase NrfD [Verrucomicrobiae bacterium]|jgi:Ni/Fe-hydrogenase subunit HybB-like protein|nr:polysulfide reductase NrfD [Verrucomicrobiae bacterium]